MRPAAKHASVVIIGGSQAGLALGYYLKRERLPFVILEQASRIGDAWRSRWDSLTLFTPARYSSLPARRHCGVEYGASALFVVRSLDRRAIPESSNIRIYHGFGPDRLIIPCSGKSAIDGFGNRYEVESGTLAVAVEREALLEVIQ